MIKQINEILNYLEGLSKKSFERLMIIIAASSAIIITLILVYVYRTNSKILTNINNLQNLTKKANVVRAKYQEIQQERTRVLELLGQEKDFEIKSFFEKFCMDHKLKPESDWATPSTPIEGNPALEEISLRATFKNQTMESLTKLLEDLSKNEMIYVKNLKITKEAKTGPKKTISFEIIIATLKSRQGLEE